MRNYYLSCVAVLVLVGGCSDTEVSQDEMQQTVDAANEFVEPQIEDAMADSAVETDASVNTLEASTEVRSLEAHVHGAATLAVVLEGNRITAELDTPLYNVLGFEVNPVNEAQTEQAARAEAALSDAARLFVFNRQAGCVAVPMTKPVRLFAETSETDSDHHDHDHDEHGHNDHNDDAHHDHDHHDHDSDDENHDHDVSHDHDHDHDDEHGEHREVRLTYTFTCENAQVLDSLTVTMFEAFPLLEALDVIYLGPNAQASFDLSPANNRISFRS